MLNTKFIKKILKAFYTIALCILPSSFLFAQATEPVEMADAFRADGKIYVVIVVIITIFIGIITYLISLDRKIKRLEEKNK